MKTHARVAIVGGGAMGVGLLYHLAEEGWGPDCVLIEKGELTSGSTWHAAGQCPQFAGSLNLAKVHYYGTQLYPKLETLTGHKVSWHGCGGVRLALTDKEVDWFHYVQGIGRMVGFDCDIVGPDDIATHHPYLDVFGVKAGFVTYTDGHVAPADIVMAMAAGARAKGAEIYRRCQVTDIQPTDSGEWRVETPNGAIVAEHVVNAAGSYADIVGAWSELQVPISNMLHHYLITEPVQELVDMETELPVVRDPYSHCYLREETDGVLIGPYETAGAHTCFDDGLAWDFESELVTPEVDRLMPWLEKATERMPLFAKAGIKSVVSGAITHTPDGNFLAGPAPGLQNYWMCAGASIGIAQGGGAGKYLAQWMVHGDCDINMHEFDPRRFGDWATADYTRTKSVEDYEAMYYCLAPGEQHPAGRPLRTSSLYNRLKERGGQFGQIFGWERPRWFAPNDTGEDYSFRRSNWWTAVEEECRAVREAVGLMDLSTFAKYEVSGAEAEAFLDQVGANRTPRRDGGVALTHLLSDNGRILSEVTVTRLTEGHYFVLSAAFAQVQDFDHLRHAAASFPGVEVRDVTDAYGTLVISGPKAREVLAPLTDSSLQNKDFPWLTGQEITVAGVAGIRALRVSYVGELGWELHTPMADMPTLFDALEKAGTPHGLRLFGTYAMNSLRLEKGFRGMGSELTNEVTLVDADMMRFARMNKPDFVGKAATANALQQGPETCLVYLTVDADDADCLGNEPVYNGEDLVGVTTSGAYGFAVGRSIAFAYVRPGLHSAGQELSIDIMGQRRKARVEDGPLYDPNSEKMRA